MRGQEKHLANPLVAGNLKINHDLFDAKTCNISGYHCPRCNKNFGYLYFEKSGCLYFCGQFECLMDDMTYTNKSKKEESKNVDAASQFGVGTRYHDACLTKWKADEEQKEQISRWLNKPKNMVVMLGRPGTGKTYFCIALANYLIFAKHQVHYMNTRRFFEVLQRAMEQDKNQYVAIEEIAKKEILIFDDLGSGMNTEWQKEVLLDLIDRRYNEEKPTIITSNLDFVNMQKTLGERIERRLNSPENLKIVVTKHYA